MSDQGGHGGASLGEIIVPIIILSPHVLFQSYKIRQDTNHDGAKNGKTQTIMVHTRLRYKP